MVDSRGLSVPRAPHEPADVPASAGSPVSATVAVAVRERAGVPLRALVLSGSHACGDAVWAHVDGRRVALSDLDLYAVLDDESACDAARARAWPAAARERLRAEGFVAPVEVAFLTEAGLSRLPARPGTLALRTHGRLLEGDAAVLRAVPGFGAEAIGREEHLALIENRGAELLGARPGDAPDDALGPWFARHATLKAALEVAGVLSLEAGAWPATAAERVRRAESRLREHPGAEDAGPMGDVRGSLVALWEEALRWREEARLPAAAAAEAEWRAVARAWCWVWWRLAAAAPMPVPDEPWAAIRRVAARAPWPRKARRALGFRPRVGPAPSLFDRARHAAAGTPAHRLMGSVTTLLFAAALAPAAPSLPSGALRLLDRLGVVSAREWGRAAREARTCWGRWVAGEGEGLAA